MSSSARSIFRRFLSSTSAFRPVSHATHHPAPQCFRRTYSSTANPVKSRFALWLGASLAVVGGGGSFYYTYYNQEHNASFKLDAPVKLEIFKPTKEDYQNVYNEIARLLIEKDEYDDGSYGPVVLRLAWHASGTYDAETGTGGSNGATMRFAPEGDHGANSGLHHARQFLEPVKEKFPWISYSDLWTLAATTAIQELQGPRIPWRPGRNDKDVSFCTPDGRLPDGSKGSSHLRAIFGRMGFDDREIVALSGAHALGRCHKDRSGFEGPWDFSPTVMTNEYFKLLVDERWEWKTEEEEGKKWNGNPQYTDKSTKTLMMIPTDMALVEDEKFREHVERYARDGEVLFKEFAEVFVKLVELGVPFTSGPEDRIRFLTLDEQEIE
ncbi:MAG: hypothetical protein Q9227_000737 [Pyrenula ochraceoflavens]